MLNNQPIVSTCDARPFSKDFPKVGSADEECTVDDGIAPCGCPARTAPPSQPTELRLPYTPENILAMKE